MINAEAKSAAAGSWLRFMTKIVAGRTRAPPWSLRGIRWLRWQQSRGGDVSDDDMKAQTLKAQFRDALQKKQNRHHATAEGAEHDTSEKSHGADKPIEVKEFRRKSI
jgi:hypothetical protein